MPAPFAPQPINFFPQAAAESQSLQAQQALAQSMMADAVKPIDPTRSAGRFVVKMNPLEGAAKMGQSYLAGVMQKQAWQKQADLQTQQLQAIVKLLRGDQPGTQAAQGTQPVQPPAGQPPPPTPESASAGPTVPSYGQPGFQPGPSPSAAQPLPVSAPTSSASLNPQPLSPQGPAQRSPLSVTGDPNRDLGLIMAPSVFGQGYGNALMKQYEPTDLQRNLAAYGGNDQQALGRATLEKGAYIAPPIVRQNSVALDPRTQQPIFSNPAAAPGTTNIWKPGNPYPTQNVRIPGSLENLGAEAAATSVGRAQGETVELTDVNGRRVVVPKSNIVGPVPGSQPNARTPGQGTPFQQGQSTYGGEFAKQAAKASNEYVDELRTGARDSVEQNRMLDQLEQNLRDFTPGKAAGARKAIAQWRVQMGIADEETKKIAASGEEGDKLVGQLVSNALKKLSARPTQMEFQIFKDQYVPNLAMTPQGAQQVVQFMRQQNNLSAQKYQAFNKWRGTQNPDTDLRDFDLTWQPKAAQAPLNANGSFPNPQNSQFNQIKQEGAVNPQSIVDELRRRGLVK